MSVCLDAASASASASATYDAWVILGQQLPDSLPSPPTLVSLAPALSTADTADTPAYAACYRRLSYFLLRYPTLTPLLLPDTLSICDTSERHTLLLSVPLLIIRTVFTIGFTAAAAANTTVAPYYVAFLLSLSVPLPKSLMFPLPLSACSLPNPPSYSTGFCILGFEPSSINASDRIPTLLLKQIG
ncbi:hypothetical protein EVAR_51511_1 [Eumeta japonica]|uniref:Uncharacterized protein n=1 Tax=Eumeta variegata TaxID=151549 RepID=A0A4C1XC05_EUMVA|nr:hypothetical protein EVAR_51511_1 [Eumeta japonica]